MAVETPPAFLQNKTYGAEQTRRAITNLIARGSTIGSIAGGIVGASDMNVTPGTGMHVIVATGESWVPGSSSATQGGYYSRVSSSTELAIATANPTNPRIDRVSALVKDEAYTGSENLFTVAVETGTPTAGATLTNLNGVAAAPTSSYTLAYVLVPAASSSVEAGNIKNLSELVTTGIPPLRVVNGATEPVSGQISEVASGTVTLPVPLRNTVVGVFNAGTSEVTVISTTHGGAMYGDFTVGATSITLEAYQHVLFWANGSNWLIIAGEPKREQAYVRHESLSSNTEYEPSATRPTFVSLQINQEANHYVKIFVGGIEIVELNTGGEAIVGYSFEVPAGKKWKTSSLAGAIITATYLAK